MQYIINWVWKGDPLKARKSHKILKEYKEYITLHVLYIQTWLLMSDSLMSRDSYKSSYPLVHAQDLSIKTASVIYP